MAKLKGICSLILLSFIIQAQHPEGHFMPFGLGYGLEVIKDQSLSPVSYSGHLGRIHSGYYFQEDHWLSQLDIAGLAGYQYPDVARNESLSQTLSILGRGSYSLSYRVARSGSQPNDWYFFAGILSHNFWDYRNHNRYSNSQDNFVGLFSAGILLTVQKPFDIWSQHFNFQYSLGLPISAYYLRPGYIKPYSNNKISSKGWAWLGDFMTLDSRSDLIWSLPNGNQIRLAYHWEYIQMDMLNSLQLGSHQLSISTVFKF